jgi:hypothetical protein
VTQGSELGKYPIPRRLGLQEEATRIASDANSYPLEGQVASHFWWNSISATGW